jgi:hypothetical protein
VAQRMAEKIHEIRPKGAAFSLCQPGVCTMFGHPNRDDIRLLRHLKQYHISLLHNASMGLMFNCSIQKKKFFLYKKKSFSLSMITDVYYFYFCCCSK